MNLCGLSPGRTDRLVYVLLVLGAWVPLGKNAVQHAGYPSRLLFESNVNAAG